MIRGLRRRLALIFGLLTSLILVVMLSITCYLARSQYQLSQEILYQTQLQALTRQLQQSANISGSWLAQMAQDENAFFYIEQNGIPLHHSAISIQDPERAALLEALRQQADALGFVPSAFETLTFTVEVSGVTYQATVCSTSDYLLFYSQDMTAQLHYLQRLTLTYCLLGGAGIAALLAVSAFLAHLATRPTERALQEQQDFIAAASHELRSPLTVIRTRRREHSSCRSIPLL